jgi:hypothetical protein
MLIKLKLTGTGWLLVVEAIEEAADKQRSAEGHYTPRGLFLLDVAHQVRMQAELPRKDYD